MGYAEGYPVRLVGGRLALDFVNTADWSADGRIVHEKLTTLEDLDVWIEASGLEAVKRPQDLEDALCFRKALRERLLRQSEAAEGLPDIHIPDRERLNLFDVLLVSAHAILLDSRERNRMKVCIGDDCGWLFIDESRGGRRHWCSMEACGNRAKARRHYARRKGNSLSDG